MFFYLLVFLNVNGRDTKFCVSTNPFRFREKDSAKLIKIIICPVVRGGKNFSACNIPYG
jgi:hypothetical protein